MGQVVNPNPMSVGTRSGLSNLHHIMWFMGAEDRLGEDMRWNAREGLPWKFHP